MNDLLCELLEAHRIARDPEAASILQACGIPRGGPVWGLQSVIVEGNHYLPDAAGHPAIVVPVSEGGKIFDLAATGLLSRRIATRTGLASILGENAINRAMAYGDTLHLFEDPIEWLQRRCAGAVVLDWRAACFALADVPEIVFSNDVLARRAYNAMTRPQRLPRLLVKEVRHVAA